MLILMLKHFIEILKQYMNGFHDHYKIWNDLLNVTKLCFVTKLCYVTKKCYITWDQLWIRNVNRILILHFWIAELKTESITQ